MQLKNAYFTIHEYQMKNKLQQSLSQQNLPHSIAINNGTKTRIIFDVQKIRMRKSRVKSIFDSGKISCMCTVSLISSLSLKWMNLKVMFLKTVCVKNIFRIKLLYLIWKEKICFFVCLLVILTSKNRHG